jgi:hypothetical protein
MTDRELLELAANAAGLHVKGWIGDKLSYFNPVNDHSGFGDWNPLADDGDALRLAVKLRIELVGVVNDAFGDPFVLVHGRNRKEFTEVVVDAELSLLATRRAIVRAAAEIGKGIQ